MSFTAAGAAPGTSAAAATLSPWTAIAVSCVHTEPPW